MISLWGIARTTIAEGIRMKVAVVFILLLVLILPTLPLASSGDGTLKGQVQSFLNYSLTATWLLLSLLTIFMSCSTLANEIKNRQVHSVASKPVPRWQMLLGKWLGITLLNVALLAGAGVAVLVCVRYLEAQPGLSSVDKQALRYEVLTARVPLRPRPPDFTQQVEARYEKLKEKGELPQTVMLGGVPAQATRQNILRQMHSELEDRWRNIHPYEGRQYEFQNVRVQREQGRMLFVRFKLMTTPLAPEELFRPVFAFGDPKYGFFTTDLPLMKVGQFHTLPVPADCLSPDGTLQVAFFNDPLVQKRAFEGTAHFDGQDGLEILYRVGSYEANLVRTLGMLLIMLMLFAAVGLMASTFLSFPVAVLLVLMIFFTGTMTNFLLEAMDYQGWRPGPDEIVGPLGYVLHPLSYAFVRLVPDLASYNPIDTFADGRNVSLVWIALSLLYLVVIRGGLVAVLALLLFYRRELGEVIV